MRVLSVLILSLSLFALPAEADPPQLTQLSASVAGLSVLELPQVTFDATALERLPVLAQVASPSAPASAIASALEWVFSPGGLAVVVAALGTLLGLIFGANSVRKRRIALAVYHAYQIVNDIDAERGDATLDKPAAGLRALDDYMRANGWRPLKPGEEQLAKLGFQALHGQEKQAVKVAQALAGAGAAQTPKMSLAPVP